MFLIISTKCCLMVLKFKSPFPIQLFVNCKFEQYFSSMATISKLPNLGKKEIPILQNQSMIQKTKSHPATLSANNITNLKILLIKLQINTVTNHHATFTDNDNRPHVAQLIYVPLSHLRQKLPNLQCKTLINP